MSDLRVAIICPDAAVSNKLASDLHAEAIPSHLVTDIDVWLGSPDTAELHIVLLDTAIAGARPELLGDLLRLGARVLMLGNGDSPEIMLNLLSGASGAIDLTEASAESIASSVQLVSQGQAALHPAVAAAILANWRDTRTVVPERAASTTSPLTARERDVLQAMALGLAAKEIARKLSVSPKTIDNHKTRIYNKLKVRGQTAAVMLALQQGWIEPMN